MEKQVGKVIATLESPNTEEFAFVVTGMVKKGQYVFLEHQNKGYIALVTEIFNSNKYFERPETVMDYEKFGDIVESFPVEDWDYTVAHAKLLGMIEGERLTRVELPPKPGAVVRIAENEMLQKFLGFDPEGIEIGYIPNHNLTVRLNVSRLFQKHLAILAMSGSGKSYLASVLIEELLNRKPEQGRVCTIILDVHGEYTSLKSAFPKQVEIVDVESSRLALRNINASHFSEWYDGITGPQMRELSMALEHLKKERKEKGISFGLKKLEEYFGKIDLKSDVFDFNFTDYYSKEMGENLKKVFVSFQNLASPESSAHWKIFSNSIEQDLSLRKDKPSRTINIDPGYVELSKVVLLTTKNYSHRIYLGKGIYAEVTLIWRNKGFEHLSWTYPDYRTDLACEFFTSVRSKIRIA